MKPHLDCIPCFIRQALDVSRIVTDDQDVHLQVMHRAIEITDKFETYKTPAAIAKLIYRAISQLTNNSDPYKELKKDFNTFVMQLYQPMKKLIAQSQDPFETAVRLAIAGNIIDFGVKISLNFEDVENTISKCLSESIDKKSIEELKTAVSSAKNILYLGDNAGEIVFDKLLIEQIGPEKITFAVRGGPVINDVTMQDAKDVGMTDIVKVIDNGDDSPGNILEDCSPQFIEHFYAADLIIAKGQGNYETLNDATRDIFFILKVKCQAIAKHLNCPAGSSIVRKIIGSND